MRFGTRLRRFKARRLPGGQLKIRTRLKSLSVVLAVAVIGCAESTVPRVDSTSAAALEIHPPGASLEAGESMKFGATVRDLAGRIKSNSSIVWTVGDAALSIDGTGFVTAADVATAQTTLVIATHAAFADTALVTIEPRAFPTVRQPVVFVHGFGGSKADWSPTIARFRADGWRASELAATTYSSNQSNIGIASAIRAYIDSVRTATGWDKVDVVSYSMGSLSSRYFLKELGGTNRVDAWVSIGGPNHGTATAYQCSISPCLEMRPGSAFLNSLNAGDETPGEVRYATWWSPCDDLVNPPESTILVGAMNTQTPCLPHTGMFTEEIYLQVKAFIRP